MLSIALLALVLVLCGLHVAGSGHDGHSEVVAADGLALIVVVAVVAMLVTRVTRSVVARAIPPARWSSDPPSRPPTTAFLTEAPLRC